MKGVVRFLSAAALLAAALPASAFLRETTVGGTPSTGVCGGGPQPLWWGGRDVTVHVNAEGVTSTACPVPADAENAVSTAMSQWGNATLTGQGSPCTDFHYTVGAPTAQRAIGNDGVNLVVFRKGLCAAGQTPATNNCWNHGIGTIALTTTTYDSDTGQIVDADIEFFSWDGANGFYLSCAAPGAPACGVNTGTGCNAVDIVSVATHEAGHMLGLDHVCTTEYGSPAFSQCIQDPGTMMNPIMKPPVGSASQQTLAQDDVNGVCSVYPKGAATASCPSTQQGSHGGCASAGGVGVLGLLGLLAAVRRRRS